MTKLTDKQALFVQEYLVDLNATQAAIRAGYSERTAQEISSENLSKPIIQEAIRVLRDERMQRTQISADYVLKGIVETIERCRQVVPVIDKKGDPVFVETPAGEIAPAYTFKAGEALKGYELLGRHLGLFNDKLQLANDPDNPITDAKARAKKLGALAKLKSAMAVIK